MIIFHSRDIQFCLDQRSGQLLKGGCGQQPIHLPRKEWQVLLYLSGRPHMVVSKSDLQNQVWGTNNVSQETSVNQAISKIRRAIGDRAESPSVIKTVQGRG